MSIHKLIIEQITRIKGGKILFPTDFRGIGADSAIKVSLSRLAKKGHLKRLSHGIYLKPGQPSKKNKSVLSAEFIAHAIAERENIRIKPAGNYALYQLGFESDKPTTITYVTDGEPRKISIDNHTIIFKSTTQKKLSMKGQISSLVIQALEDVGKDDVNAELGRTLRT